MITIKIDTQKHNDKELSVTELKLILIDMYSSLNKYGFHDSGFKIGKNSLASSKVNKQTGTRYHLVIRENSFAKCVQIDTQQ